MNRVAHNKRVEQRVLYTLCFFALCLIDWMKVSLNGRVQMTATNVTGIVIAFIILSSFDFKRFFKPIFAVWLVACIIAVLICFRTVFAVYPYKGQIITATLNIVLYGFILLRLLTDFTSLGKKIGVHILVFICWLVMLGLMILSVNENIWPIWYAVVFGSFYVTEFDSDAEKHIFVSVPDGIILGFFVIQGTALLFRPYDYIRYLGLYINPNFNALFYLMSYSAFLCKWYLFKKEGKSIYLRMLLCLFSASMYGFCIYTGSKSAILAMLVVTIPFSILILKLSKHKMMTLVKCWFALGIIGIISVPVVYWAIRYMPTIHLHPLYFEGEYSSARIQPGEPRDSEKYISFERAMEFNLGRFVYILPRAMDYYDSIIILKVQAAELEEFQEPEYVFSQEDVADGINPIELRREIRKYYISRLNMFGHTNDYEGAPISVYTTAPHAHNVFIQMAFLYGIPAGLLFALMFFTYIPACINLMKLGEDYRVCLIACFVSAFVIFGCFEIDWMCGQLPFTMIFLLYRDVLRKKDVKFE